MKKSSKDDINIKPPKYKTSVGSKIFTVCNVIFMILFVTVTLYPVLNTLAISFNDGVDALRGGCLLYTSRCRKFVRGRLCGTLCFTGLLCYGSPHPQKRQAVDRDAVQRSGECIFRGHGT